MFLSLNKQNLKYILFEKNLLRVYTENRDIKIKKKDNTNKFVKQHRSQNLQHKANSQPESIYANIEMC